MFNTYVTHNGHIWTNNCAVSVSIHREETLMLLRGANVTIKNKKISLMCL